MSENIYNVVNDLIRSHDRLGVKDRDEFPISDPTIIKDSKLHDEFFQTYIKDNGYYDLFIV